jgi:hypothetical protein
MRSGLERKMLGVSQFEATQTDVNLNFIQGYFPHVFRKYHKE